MTLSERNALVRGVEHAADCFRQTARTMEPYATSKAELRLIEKLRAAGTELDKRALRMIALYDPVARDQARQGQRTDLRRQGIHSRELCSRAERLGSRAAHVPQPDESGPAVKHENGRP